MTSTLTDADHRTTARKVADEEIAWSVERFIVTDPATGWAIHEATDERRRLADEADDDNAIADGGLNVPFLWNGRVYRITKARCSAGRTEVEAVPNDPPFVAEVRRRIDAVPYRVLTFCQGFGFVCFPEDHAKYLG